MKNGKWETTSLGEIATVSSGGTPSRRIPEYWDGQIPWVTTSKINFNIITESEEYITEKGLKHSSAKVFPKGTLLMAMYGQGATRGRIGILGIDAAINQACASITPIPNVSSKYLYYFLASNYEQIRAMAHGGNQSNLSGELIKSIIVTLPTYPEQEAIAKTLAIWDSCVEKLDKLIIAKNKYEHCLALQLLTGRKRFQMFRGQSWKPLKISDFAKLSLRPTPKPDKPFKSLGIRSHGKGTFLKEDFEPQKIELAELFEVKENDLIVNITFAWEGAIAIASSADSGALVSHRFPTYVFDTEMAIPEYFRHVIIQKWFVEKLGLISPGGAGRNRVLSKKDFAKLEVLMPSVEEQRKIAAVLNACDREIDLLQKQLAALKKQKQGLMQKLLTGQIRVKV